MTRVWSASRLTYLALGLSALLSIFPIYWMFVVASRTSDAMGQSRRRSPPAATWAPTSPGCSTTPTRTSSPA